MASDNDNIDSIDLLLVLSRTQSAAIAAPLLAAAARKKLRVAAFLTGEASILASDSHLGEQLAGVGTAIVCAESWHAETAKAGSETCRIELGSQTDHSRLVGFAKKIVSL